MKNIPEIRLKGFEGEWCYSKLEKLSTFSKGQGYSKGDLNLAGNTPIILYGRMYTNYKPVIMNVDTFADKKGNSILSEGCEVIVPASGETAEDISIASAVIQKGVILGGDLNIIKPHKELAPSFLALSISNSKVHKDLSTKAQGKSIVHLHNEDLKNVSISYPNIVEQQSIGTFFQNLDNLLTEQKNKLENLQKVKKSMLCKMFPQEGQKVPDIRFKGFEGDWEEKKFENIYEHHTIKNDGTFGLDKVISVASMYFKNEVSISDEGYLKTYNIFKLGDIAFEGNKSKYFAHGRFVENTIGGGIVSHVFEVFSPIMEQYDINFWKYLINNENVMGPILMRSTKASTMMTNLVVNDFLKEKLMLPSYEEQKLIGGYLYKIDRLIVQKNNLYKRISHIKQSLLSKMFV